MKTRKTIIMGILNTTPDSFSDGGTYVTKEEALKQVEKMIEDGAEIIDVGGESTRPNAEVVSEEEELRRVIPIISAIKEQFNILVSIDTYKPNVAKQALNAGADIVNDIWGGSKDSRMLDLIIKRQVPYIAMHNQETKEYNNLIGDMDKFFLHLIQRLKEGNYPMDKLILDPGIGFAKTHEDNVKVMQNLNFFNKYGTKLLLGTSRKSMIGIMNDEDSPKNRVIGTCATTVMAVQAGYDIVRVHDVCENRQAIEVADVIYRA